MGVGLNLIDGGESTPRTAIAASAPSVAELQKGLGVTADGVLGPGTCRAANGESYWSSTNPKMNLRDLNKVQKLCIEKGLMKYTQEEKKCAVPRDHR